MEYPMGTQSLKQKEFLLQLAQEKSSYFNRKYRLIRLFYFQKYRKFIGSRSCPNLTKLGMEYPTCIQSLKQKEFLLQLAQEKSSYFNRKYRLIRLFYFQKYRNFIGSRSCPNLTKLGIEYPMCAQIVKQKEFLLQLAQKKSQYCIRKFAIISNKFAIIILKIGLIRRVKELSKSNQTQHGVSKVYLESKIERIFAIACLGKKFVFQSEIQTYSLILFSKIQKFYRIKELSKSNQTRYRVSHVCVDCKTKRIFAIACLGKKLVLHTEICYYFE